MELIGAEVQGFRRFNESTNIRLLENLIALIGQNESGKTSFLEALETLNDHEEIEDQDQTRRVDTTTEIAVTFKLEDADHQRLEHVENAEVIEQCTFTKHEDGRISVSLDEKPTYDLQLRKEVHSQLKFFVESDEANNHIARKKLQNLRAILEVLDSDADYLGDEKIEQIRGPIPYLNNVIEDADANDSEIESIETLTESLEELADHEKNSSPQQARQTLLHSRPKFLIFGEEDRELQSTYDLTKTAPNPPSALANLADLAGLDLQDLADAAESEKVHLRRDLMEEANEKLESEFSDSWVRDDVSPVLTVDGTILHIHVRTPDEQNRAPINQRSDGLRWFVALVAFLNQEDAGDDPILLVDEAERHLSYDAQAELVEVLETQTVAQKVIYTTHSAGCLPSDLGRGIRPVIQQEGERSDIKNGFWTEEPGFKPIMVAMGLNPLAFTVTRNSLIAEGPSETILLPTLLRQATEKSELKYQIAPGAANVGEERISELLSETGRSIILLDGDEGGVENRDDLIEAGADPEKIKTCRDFSDEPLMLEDFVALEKYVEAVNDELNGWQDPATELSTEDFDDENRIDTVKDWCEERGLDAPMKVNVSQRLVKMASEDTDIINPDHRKVLCQIDSWTDNHFLDLSQSQ